MPDLHTALEQALTKSKEKQMLTGTNPKVERILKEWEEADKQRAMPTIKDTRFKETNHVSRATFEAIRDNPNSTYADICKLLQSKGYKTSSTSSLIYQLVNNGYVTRTPDGRLHTKIKEYQPIKSKKQLNKLITHVAKGRAGIASLATKQVAPKETTNKTTGLDIDAFLSTLSLPDSVALFNALQRMFNSIKGV